MILNFSSTPFGNTPTHSSHPPPHPYIPDPNDIDPVLLGNFNKIHTRKSISIPISNKGCRRHSQFDPSLPLPKPSIPSQPDSSLPSPKPLTIPVHEPFREKYPLTYNFF